MKELAQVPVFLSLDGKVDLSYFAEAEQRMKHVRDLNNIPESNDCFDTAHFDPMVVGSSEKDTDRSCSVAISPAGICCKVEFLWKLQRSVLFISK